MRLRWSAAIRGPWSTGTGTHHWIAVIYVHCCTRTGYSSRLHNARHYPNQDHRSSVTSLTVVVNTDPGHCPELEFLPVPSCNSLLQLPCHLLHLQVMESIGKLVLGPVREPWFLVTKLSTWHNDHHFTLLLNPHQPQKAFKVALPNTGVLTPWYLARPSQFTIHTCCTLYVAQIHPLTLQGGLAEAHQLGLGHGKTEPWGFAASEPSVCSTPKSLFSIFTTNSRNIFLVTPLKIYLKGLSIVSDQASQRARATITPGACSPQSWAICFSARRTEPTFRSSWL